LGADEKIDLCRFSDSGFHVFGPFLLGLRFAYRSLSQERFGQDGGADAQTAC
jgi:hypothetical protein